MLDDSRISSFIGEPPEAQGVLQKISGYQARASLGLLEQAQRLVIASENSERTGF
jgi:hypothetical protein